jgi:UDP-N-acetylglucosamine/UDP-N-acetylgalactosamine diphosphorylase
MTQPKQTDTAAASAAVDHRLKALMEKGVVIHGPSTVSIGDEVDPERIAAGAVIHPGCRIRGAHTLILKGAEVGSEAPATLENCCVGPAAALKGGFFKGAVFLKGAAMGSGAHVREGTLLEERASGAHTVGLKQTLLFPFVTLGSLINFCDCLMAGGTGPKNHSEVGSSYIHFNFTPNGDKATASLIGDVPQGVMLNKQPIFLGGQGGLVGPRRLAFGTVVAAGTICRKDEVREDRLIFGGGMKPGNVPATVGSSGGGKRVILSNIIYVANLMALRQWYGEVRRRFIGEDLPEDLLTGARNILETAVGERMKRLAAFVEGQETILAERWPGLGGYLESAGDLTGDARLRDPFLEAIDRSATRHRNDYVNAIQGLESGDSKRGTDWLRDLVERITSGAVAAMPALQELRGKVS